MNLPPSPFTILNKKGFCWSVALSPSLVLSNGLKVCRTNDEKFIHVNEMQHMTLIKAKKMDRPKREKIWQGFTGFHDSDFTGKQK